MAMFLIQENVGRYPMYPNLDFYLYRVEFFQEPYRYLLPMTILDLHENATLAIERQEAFDLEEAFADQGAFADQQQELEEIIFHQGNNTDVAGFRTTRGLVTGPRRLEDNLQNRILSILFSITLPVLLPLFLLAIIHANVALIASVGFLLLYMFGYIRAKS